MLLRDPSISLDFERSNICLTPSCSIIFSNSVSQYYYNVEVILATTFLTMDALSLETTDESVTNGAFHSVTAQSGSMTTFTGRLVNANTDVGISNAIVYVYDYDSVILNGVYDDFLVLYYIYQ